MQAELTIPEFAKVAHEPVLLTDQQVLDFIIDGYVELRPDGIDDANRNVTDQLEKQGGQTVVDLQNDPTSLEFLRQIHSLVDVIGHPQVRGAIHSLLGANPFIFGRYVHANKGGTGGRGWHQDDVNVRHYQVRRLMILYYPNETTPDMGPTIVVPGSHLRNCPTDRMQTYGNIRGQVPLVGPAGRVYVTHYDIWHSASKNKSNKTRNLVKYYLDRTSEPVSPNWNHNPDTAIDVAMQQLHHRRTAGSGGGCDWYKERNLRWRMWSHLLGRSQAAVWPKWDEIHGQRRQTSTTGEHDYQGYVGAPMY